MKTALITGITGQDGSYLAQLLLKKGYEVYGTARNIVQANCWRLAELGIERNSKLHIVQCSFINIEEILRLLASVKPDEVYNLAAASFVAADSGTLEEMAQINGVGVLRMLEAVRQVNPEIRLFQAGSSEMFGSPPEFPQNECTNFCPCNPYGAAKLYAHHNVVVYKNLYGMFACNGILFNHESPLRGENFVTKKIVQSFASAATGENPLELGNLDAHRDWGYAPEYVEGMWRTLQYHEPDTYVFATGRSLTIRYFVELAASIVGIPLQWEGTGLEEVGVHARSGHVVVRVNPLYYRKESRILVGDATKAKNRLNWQAKITLEKMCQCMMEYELQKRDI